MYLVKSSSYCVNDNQTSPHSHFHQTKSNLDILMFSDQWSVISDQWSVISVQWSVITPLIDQSSVTSKHQKVIIIKIELQFNEKKTNVWERWYVRSYCLFHPLQCIVWSVFRWIDTVVAVLIACCIGLSEKLKREKRTWKDHGAC